MPTMLISIMMPLLSLTYNVWVHPARAVADASIELAKNMATWSPGKQRGKDVPVNITLPVIFDEHAIFGFIGVKAVNNISFTVNHGDIFAFPGPNGAGKTTTLRILLDIIKVESKTYFM